MYSVCSVVEKEGCDVRATVQGGKRPQWRESSYLYELRDKTTEHTEYTEKDLLRTVIDMNFPSFLTAVDNM